MIIVIENRVREILNGKYNLPPNINKAEPKEHEHIKIPYRNIFEKHYREYRSTGGDENAINEIAARIAKERASLPIEKRDW